MDGVFTEDLKAQNRFRVRRRLEVEQFAVIMTHSPDQCPTANETVRKLFLKTGAELPMLAKKLGVEFVAGPLITTDHKAISIVKAKEVKAVRDFILQSGLIQWNSAEVMNVISMEEATEEINKLRPIY